MQIKDIWGKVNVSTLLVFPLFSELGKDLYAAKSRIKFPILQVAYEYGLLKTFLFSELSKVDDALHIAFDKEIVLRKMKLTNSLYYSLSELIIDSSSFKELAIYNDCIIYSLQIPEKWKKDVDLIKQGKYYHVSEECKERLRIKERFPSKPFVKNELGHFIIEKNLPYAIVMKARKLREDIENIIDHRIPPEQEYFDIVNETKETLNPKAIEQLWQA